jgi:ATP phosphoribosyltransferase regulatory subunit
MLAQTFSVDRPLPEGVRDLLFADAVAIRGMASALRAIWRNWSYHEIILPTFEYAATLATDVGAEIDAEMYRFLDRQGRTLALRPDMTIPTARVIGTRLYDQAMPIRASYIGSVFRYEPPRAGRQHEFIQAGVELIGAPGRAADAEVVALAVAALHAVGLPEYRITLGHVGFFRGLLGALALPERLAGRLRLAVARKAEAEVADLLSSAGTVAAAARRALLALPRLTGSTAVLAEAEEVCLNPGMAHAIADLQASAKLLDAYGVADLVTYDLAEVRDLDYYTGITFEGFAPGLGTSLISGGRYDDLIGRFGPAQPAVGWALTLDQVLVAREMQGIVQPEPAADILVSVAARPESLAWVGEARARGLQVEVDPLGLEPEALWAAARGRGIPRVAWPDEVRGNREQEVGNRAQGTGSREQEIGTCGAAHDHGEQGAGPTTYSLVPTPYAGAWVVRDANGPRVLAAGDWEELARWLR